MYCEYTKNVRKNFQNEAAFEETVFTLYVPPTDIELEVLVQYGSNKIRGA